MRTSFKLWIAFALFGGAAPAQVSYYNFNVNNGLPSNEVDRAFQDSHGYIWFGTDHGIARYDGHEFKLFTTENGLTDNTVFVIKEDNRSNIWCLTFAGGICYYDGKTFRPHPRNDSIVAMFRRALPTSWAVTDTNTLWMGFAGRSICKINGNEIKTFNVGPFPVNKDSAEFIVVNLKDNNFVYTSGSRSNRISIVDPEVATVQTLDFSDSGIKGPNNNFGLVRIGNGSIIISQGNSFVHIAPTDKRSKIIFPAGDGITGAKSIDGNNVWILIQNGPSYLVKPDSQSLLFVDSFVFTNAATDIIKDRQGNTWISTLNAGVFMVQNGSIRSFDFHGRGIDTRAYSLKQFGERMYVGLSQNSYLRIDKNLHGTFIQGTKYPASVWSFAPSAAGNVITDVDLTVSSKDLLIFKDLLQIDSGRLLGGGTGGVVILNRRFEVMFNSKSLDFNQRINRMAKISPSRFALGTNTGLYYFEMGPEYRFIKEKYFSDTRITACKALNDSIYGVATRGKGVFISIKNKFYSVNTDRGLKTNLNEDIYFESDWVLWIASYKGIARVYFLLDRDSFHLKIKCYTREDGLCSDQVNAILGFNGYIWLATNEGICYFKPADLPEDTCTIPLYFGNLFVNGIKRSPDSMVLQYNENNLLIEFHGLYFKATSGVTYKVRLKGKEQWKLTNQNYVQYFNLPAGNYELEVAAGDKFGKYVSPVINLKFTIHPKFTDTALFMWILIVGAFAIIGFISYLLFRYQRLKSRNFINLLKAEFKALNYQINPHFIFNVLNSIQYYILRKESDKAVHFLNSFSILIRRIVTNSRQQYISVIEEVECLKEYMDLEKLRLDNKFDYEINIDSRVDIEAKTLLPMIIQPIVENSIWHGIVPSGIRGKVKVDFKYESNILVVMVEDNGVGLDPDWQNANRSPQHLSMAMSNVKERLKIIGDLNDDDTWYIHMEDKRDKGLNGSGMIVTIRFPEIKMKQI